MRDPAGNFAPGCLFLCPEKIRKIFKHDHIAQFFAGVLQCGHGYCNIKFRALQSNFHLGGCHSHSIGATQ